MGNKSPAKNIEGKKVVVVGGGYAGCVISKKLEKIGFEVTLIDRKSFFFHSVAALRTCYREGWEDLVCIPYTKLLTRENAVIQGEVTEIHPDKKSVVVQVESENGEKTKQELNYDYLILATGAPVQAAFPARLPRESETKLQYIEFIKAFRQAIHDAKDIVLVGGGPVGVELAGELRDGYADKNITIINSTETLLGSSLPKFKKDTTDRTLNKLKQHNVNVLLGKKADLSFWENDQLYMTGTREVAILDEETKCKADLVICCIGNAKRDGQEGTAQSLYPQEWVDEKGSLKVNKHLQIESIAEGNVFAIGDIANLQESKLAYYAKLQAEVLYNNICSLASCKVEHLHEYVAQEKANGIFPIGAHDGVVELKGMSLPNFIGKRLCSFLKGKTLLMETYYDELNQTLPKF